MQVSFPRYSEILSSQPILQVLVHYCRHTLYSTYWQYPVNQKKHNIPLKSIETLKRDFTKKVNLKRTWIVDTPPKDAMTVPGYARHCQDECRVGTGRIVELPQSRVQVTPHILRHRDKNVLWQDPGWQEPWHSTLPCPQVCTWNSRWGKLAFSCAALLRKSSGFSWLQYNVHCTVHWTVTQSQ